MGLAIEQNATDDGFDVRSLSLTCPDGFTIGEHDHPWGQLVYGTSGVMQVTEGNTIWFVPPTRAIWLPPERSHRIVMQGDVAMRTLYLSPERSTNLASDAVALEVSPLLRVLIVHILKLGMLDRHVAEQDNLARVLTDLITQARPGNLCLAKPRDPRACAVAQWFQENPSARLDLGTVAARAGGSLRTLQRLFTSETGLSMESWRQKVRLISAVASLSRGANVTEAALDCGYDSTSAFIVVFKKQFGMTPGRYRASVQGTSVQGTSPQGGGPQGGSAQSGEIQEG